MIETFDVKQFDVALRSILESEAEEVRPEVRKMISSRQFLAFIRGALSESYGPASEGRIDLIIASAFHVGFSTGCAYSEMQQLEEMVK